MVQCNTYKTLNKLYCCGRLINFFFRQAAYCKPLPFTLVVMEFYFQESCNLLILAGITILLIIIFFRRKSWMEIISTTALSVTVNRMLLVTLNFTPCLQFSTCNCYDLCLTGEAIAVAVAVSFLITLMPKITLQLTNQKQTVL